MNAYRTLLTLFVGVALFMMTAGVSFGADASKVKTQKVKPGTLSGVVHDGTGKKMADAKIRILDGEGNLAGEGATNKYGLYQIRNLPEGEFTLQVNGTDVAHLVVTPDSTVTSVMVFMPKATPGVTGVNWTLVAAGAAAVAVAVPIISHNSQDSDHTVSP